MLECLHITTRADVAAARQQARAEAVQAGLSPTRAEDIAIVATELTTNILKYAGTGCFLAQVMPQPMGVSLALIAFDDGPGIDDLDRMRQDRISEGDSAGIGIGAIERLSDRAEIVTGPTGTVWACRFDTAAVTRPHGLDIAGLRLSHPTETVCGDVWGTTEHRGGVRLVLADGMGHGDSAAEAGQAMVDGALHRPIHPPKQRLLQIADDLKRTRGGVMSLLDLQPGALRVDYGNLGNISAFYLRRGDQKRLATRDGYIGSPAARPMEERIDLEPGDTFVLHSDGLRTVGPEDTRPLFGQSALMTAALLMANRDLYRRDDISVAVAHWVRSDD